MTPSRVSVLDSLTHLPETEQLAFLASLDQKEAGRLEFDWTGTWARNSQVEPPAPWDTWLILAGRGFGKTRTGAEWVRDNVCGSTPLGIGKFKHVALIAETAADARDVMVGDGKLVSDPTAGSGLLQVHPKDYRPLYIPSKRRLEWPNGAMATIYNAVEPDQLRGPEHDAGWLDELVKFRYAQDTWDMFQFGLRKGMDPRCLITTTPKPIKLLKDIMKMPGTVVTRGSTSENRRNLAQKFLDTLMLKYAGTRLGRQELDAEILEDVAGALWQRFWIEATRVRIVEVPLAKVVVAIDPGVTTGDNADETGITVTAKGIDDRGYVLNDLSGIYTPAEWAQHAVDAYRLYGADVIVGEANNGGDMIEHTLRVIDPNVSYRKVTATRGKAIRAQPVAQLYEKGRVSHVGSFPELEDQMCSLTPDFDRATAGYSPDRADSLVWGLTELFINDGGFIIGSF